MLLPTAISGPKRHPKDDLRVEHVVVVVVVVGLLFQHHHFWTRFPKWSNGSDVPHCGGIELILHRRTEGKSTPTNNYCIKEPSKENHHLKRMASPRKLIFQSRIFRYYASIFPDFLEIPRTGSGSQYGTKGRQWIIWAFEIMPDTWIIG